MTKKTETMDPSPDTKEVRNESRGSRELCCDLFLVADVLPFALAPTNKHFPSGRNLSAGQCTK